MLLSILTICTARLYAPTVESGSSRIMQTDTPSIWEMVISSTRQNDGILFMYINAFFSFLLIFSFSFSYGVGHLINHSVGLANVAPSLTSGDVRRLVFVATRAIEINEQLFYDYGHRCVNSAHKHYLWLNK